MFVAVIVILAATVEESILSYEPVITQECEFCRLLCFNFIPHEKISRNHLVWSCKTECSMYNCTFLW